MAPKTDQQIAFNEALKRVVRVNGFTNPPDDVVDQFVAKFTAEHDGNSPLKLGGYTVWVGPTGEIRSKLGAPTAPIDGAPVGTLLGPTPDSRFSIKAFGGDSTATVSSQTAIDNAIVAAKAHVLSPTNTYGSKATIVFESGNYLYDRPIFVPLGVTLMCEGRNDAVLYPSGFDGYTLIIGRDVSNLAESHGPYALGSFATPGQYTYAYPGRRASDNHFYDLAQVATGRLPNKDVQGKSLPWTISHHFKFGDVSSFAPIWSIAGTLYTAQQSACLQVVFQLNSSLRVDFRYNGQSYTRTINVPNPPVIVVGTGIDLEISWTGTQLRVFLNGQLWNDGAWTPIGGFGKADTTGFVQQPWETLCLGMGQGGYLQEEIIVPNVAGTLSRFHISDMVRHTTSFTPPATVTADAHTQLLINFDQFYKGMLVGDSGTTGRKQYIYPWVSDVWETPSVSIKNLFLYGGGGIYAPFASALYMENVQHLYANDGWRFNHNGYFSHFRNCDVISGSGRSGFDMQGGSYCSVNNCTMANAMGFTFNAANVFGSGNSATVHPNCYMGLYYSGAGILDWTGFSIDAEEPTTVGWLAAVVTVDPASFTLRTPTLYGPGNCRVTHPIVLSMNQNDNQTMVFEQPIFAYPPSQGAIFQNALVANPAVGMVNWSKPAIVSDPHYYTPLFQLADSPGNVLDVTEVRNFENSRLGSGPPVSGYWRQGTKFVNNNPRAGGWERWVCVTSGSPGIWKGTGLIES